MRRRDRGAKEHEVKVDMTPLIDCTFLLVMFFVLTSSFTSLNLEEVLLPVALKAADQKAEASTLIINIKKVDDTTRDGRIIFNGSSHTESELVQALRIEVKVHGDLHGMDPPAAPGAPELSKLEVLVRADEGVRGEFLRQVFRACGEVGIWKVKLSALQNQS